MELTRNNAEWDDFERLRAANVAPAKTIAEQNERLLQQQNEFQRGRIEAPKRNSNSGRATADLRLGCHATGAGTPMNRSRRERMKIRQEKPNDRRIGTASTPQPRKSIRSWGFVALIIAGGIITFVAHRNTQKAAGLPSQNSVVTAPARPAAAPANLTLGKLLDLKPDQLATADLAEVNLLCAAGLPGTENFDIRAGLAKLDGWTRIVEREIARNRHRFEENPAEYDKSENLFKMVMLVLTVQQDLYVHYDAAMMGTAAKPNATKEEIERDLSDESYFKNAASIFLNGTLSEAHTGTCASMPVLYTAIGRRLGFPIKLVAAKGHLFVRWDDGKERFNMEGTGGVNSLPDDYYKKWPLPLSPAEIASGEYLKSLSPAEELAVFLEARAVCFRANGRNDEAMEALAQAYRIDPKGTNRKIGLAKAAEAVTAAASPNGAPHPLDGPLVDMRRAQEINRANRERVQHPVTLPPIPSDPFSHFPRQNP